MLSAHSTRQLRRAYQHQLTHSTNTQLTQSMDSTSDTGEANAYLYQGPPPLTQCLRGEGALTF